MKIKKYQIIKDQGDIKIKVKIKKFLFFYEWRFLTFCYVNSLLQVTTAHHTFKNVDSALNFIHSRPRPSNESQSIDVLTDEVEHYRTINLSQDILDKYNIAPL